MLVCHYFVSVISAPCSLDLFVCCILVSKKFHMQEIPKKVGIPARNSQEECTKFLRKVFAWNNKKCVNSITIYSPSLSGFSQTSISLFTDPQLLSHIHINPNTFSNSIPGSHVGEKRTVYNSQSLL